MEALYLTKVTPVRGEDFEIRGWAPAGRVLVNSQHLLCAEVRPEMENKVVVTLVGGKDFVVEEKIEDIVDTITEVVL